MNHDVFVKDQSSLIAAFITKVNASYNKIPFVAADVDTVEYSVVNMGTTFTGSITPVSSVIFDVLQVGNAIEFPFNFAHNALPAWFATVDTGNKKTKVEYTLKKAGVVVARVCADRQVFKCLPTKSGDCCS